MLPTPADTPPPISTGSGFLPVVSNAELVAQERRAEEQAAKKLLGLETSLAAHIRRCWDSNQNAKRTVEEQMLKNLRQRQGEYEADKLAQIKKFGGSELFIKLTDLKCRAGAAWIKDILTMERPWDLEPGPIADLSPEVKLQAQQQAYQAVVMQARQAMIMGGMVDMQAMQQAMQEQMQQAMDAATEKLTQIARRTAERMAVTIEDQLDEGGFQRALDQIIDHDLVTFGTGIIKAPVLRTHSVLGWKPDEMTGQFAPQYDEVMRPEVERVSPLDLYPSEGAVTLDDGDLIERYRLSRRELLAFRDMEGFKGESIDSALKEYSKGLSEQTSTDSDRRQLEARSSTLNPLASETIDALIFYGDVQGQMLLDWGLTAAEIPDPLEEYAVECWLVGRFVVRVLLATEHWGRPYQLAHFVRRPDSFWGVGVPELMDDIQAAANAVVRALVNNAAIASGPQVGLMINQMPPGEDGSTMHPWKIWRFGEMAYQDGRPPITFFQPDFMAQQLMQMYNEFKNMADEVTGIPAYVQGDPQSRGAGRTASGLSMLMGAAAKTIKAVVSNIDTGLTEPLIAKFYIYNMLHNEDESIKGDAHPVAKGAASLVVKEQATMRRLEFLQTSNNPVDVQIMGLGRRAMLLRSIAKSLDLEPDDIAPTREEMERQQAMQMQPQISQQPAQPQAQITGPDGNPPSGEDYALYKGTH